MMGWLHRHLDKPIGYRPLEIVDDRPMMLTEVVEQLRAKAMTAQQFDLINSFIISMNRKES